MLRLYRASLFSVIALPFGCPFDSAQGGTSPACIGQTTLLGLVQPTPQPPPFKGRGSHAVNGVGFLLALALLVPCLALAQISTDWHSDGWNYRRSITLSPATSVDSYQVRIQLNTANFDYSKALSNGADIRFYNSSGMFLPYWIENWDNADTSALWVRVPTAGTSEIFMYYGNSSATSESNGNAVFEFFDDFSIDPRSNYTTGISPSPLTWDGTEGVLKIHYNGGSGYGYWMRTDVDAGDSCIVSVKVKEDNYDDTFGIGLPIKIQNPGTSSKKAIYIQLDHRNGIVGIVDYRGVGDATVYHSADHGIQGGQWYRLTIKKYGNDYSFFLNDESLFSGEILNEVSDNKIGIMLSNVYGDASAGYGYHEDLYIAKYSGTETVINIGNEEVSSSLVAYYPFNGNANDESGNANHGTVYGSTLAADRFGNANSAYSFDGVDDRISIPVWNWETTIDYAVTAWVKSSDIDDAGQNWRVGAPVLGDTTSTVRGEVGLDNGNIAYNYYPGYYYPESEGMEVQGTTMVADDTWHFLTWVNHSNNTIDLYLDGVIEVAGATSGPVITPPELFRTNSIGQGALDWFGGVIDDVRLLNRTLSTVEIDSLYHLGGWDPDTSLVAYYPFNGNADDESENANHGTVNGATLAEDRFGNASSAYSFDGTNDWITATDQNGYLGQPFQDFTIAGWIYSNGQQASYVFRAASSDGDLHLGTPDNAHAAITAKIGGVVEKAYYPFLHNTWEYIVGTWDGSRLIFFFNGSPVDTVLTSGSLNPAPTLWGNSIGGNVDGTYSFDGLIDDIRIYNRALSEAEIQALYHEGGWDPGLVAHYPFNGNANDESGNGNNGTPMNGVALTADRFGNANSAYSFDGVDDYILIPDDNSLDLPSQITLTAWVNTSSGEGVIISKEGYGEDQSTDRNYYLCVLPTLLNLYASFEDGTGYNATIISADPILPNVWQHIAWTFDGSYLKTYINGDLDSTHSDTHTPNIQSHPVSIGVRKRSSDYQDWFNGLIDDIRIYNRALSEAEIQALYHEGETVDITGPTIADISTTSSPSIGDNITVTATITDPQGLAAVDLHYARGGATVFTEVPMSFQGNDTELGTIPGSAVTEKGVAYFIAAEDNLGNVSRSDTMSIQVGFPSGTIATSMSGSAFPDGFPKNKWRLISIPGDIADTTVSGIIEAELESAPSDETWKIFEYTGPNPDDYVAATSFASGESYFLKQVVEETVHFTLGAGQSVDLTRQSLTLGSRKWRFVSSPYPFAVSVAADQGTFNGPYTYGAFGSGGQEGWSMTQVQTTFQPWGGYIVYNNTDQTQTLEIRPPGLGKAILAKHVEDELPAGWLLHLTAEGEHYFDEGNTIGRIQGASNDRDEFDSPEPPYLDGYVSLAMDRPDWSPSAGLSLFTSDVRILDEINGVWDLDLHTRGETGPITITYNIQGEVPPGTQVVLLDLVQRRACDLTAGELPEAVTDYSEELPRRLKVIAGTPDYVQGTIEEALARLPEEFALSQNYPNPFNPSTTIEYALPKPARVSLHIYNLLGREIAVLVNDWQDMGYYEIVWQGRDRAGRSVATGVYFTVLHADGHVLTRKMVLLR